MVNAPWKYIPDDITMNSDVKFNAEFGLPNLSFVNPKLTGLV